MLRLNQRWTGWLHNCPPDLKRESHWSGETLAQQGRLEVPKRRDGRARAAGKWGEARGAKGDQAFDAGGEGDDTGRTKLGVGGDAKTRKRERVERMRGIGDGDVLQG